jgi:hypothetical protein
VTLPTPDAQSPNFLSQQTPSNHSIHTNHSIPPALAPSSHPLDSERDASAKFAHERAINFATHSWDLASGGLKTLTAKRELPSRMNRRISKQSPDTPATPRSYAFPLVILACIMIMLISGGIVLYIMLQP